MPAGQDWTRPELLKALSLYCQIPFGQFHSKNAHVKALAAELGRTPAAVAYKLSNLASLDPYHAARGVRGMANASNADRAIWAEFYGKWNKLAKAMPASLASAATRDESTFAVPTRPRPGRAPASTEAIRPTTVRIGQAFFRNAVLAAWGGQCALTGISEPALLRASHIRPWATHPEHRLDPTNGLCLNALHDAAFDRGFITFTDRFELKLSPTLRKSMPKAVFAEMFAKWAGNLLRVPDRFRPSEEAMAYHRCERFIDPSTGTTSLIALGRAHR